MTDRAKGLGDFVPREHYPLTSIVEGWRFRLVEVSSGAYEVEGFDASGRRVHRSGTNDVKLLEAAAMDARAINAQVSSVNRQ
jgi:hypothetical protein